MEFTNPTRAAQGKPTLFQLGVRLCHGFKDGLPNYIDKGEKLTIPAEQAEKWKKQGLGQILGDAPAVEVKGKPEK